MVTHNIRQDIANMISCINVIHDLVFTIFLIEKWRQEYNTFRPHSALGYFPPALEAVLSPIDALLLTTSVSIYLGLENRGILT